MRANTKLEDITRLCRVYIDVCCRWPELCEGLSLALPRALDGPVRGQETIIVHAHEVGIGKLYAVTLPSPLK